MANKASRLIQLYVWGTCAYGFAHAVTDTWSRKTNMYRKHYSEPDREMLLVDKLGLITANTVSTPILWPILLREDLIRLECLARGKPIRDYLPASDEP